MKKSWKKLISLFTAALLLSCSAAYAEKSPGTADAPLSRLYGAGEKLLSEEENFTAEGTADFYLDGTLFKHAYGLYAQQDYSSYQQISLRTPREDGSFLENGYAVYDDSGEGYYVEKYRNIVIMNPINNAAKNHALRPDLPSVSLLRLGRSVAEYLDRDKAGQVLAEPDGSGQRLTLRWTAEDVPALADAAINLFWQASITRYFGILYNDMPVEGYADVEDYLTVTEGILYCLRELALEELDVSARLDGQGRLEQLKGNVSLQVTCRNDSVRILSVSFDLSVRDYGSTVAEAVIRDEYSLDAAQPWNGMAAAEIPEFFGTAAAKGIVWEDFGLPAVPFPDTRLEHRNIVSADDAEAYARDVASMDCLGIAAPDRLGWICSQPDDSAVFETQAFDPETPDEPLLSIVFDQTGRIRKILNFQTGLDRAEDYYTEELDSDECVSWRSEIGLMLWLFTENMNPGSTRISPDVLRESMERGVGYTSYEATLRTEDEQFLVFYGVLNQNPMEKVKYVVQTAPFFRVILMDTTVDPEEGGNG